MRIVRYVCAWLAVVTLQLGQFGWNIKPNLLLIAVIIISARERLGVVLGFALPAAFIFDIFSGANFGLNMAFFFLVGLACKAIFHLEELRLRALAQSLLLVIMTIAYNFAIAISYLQVGVSRPWMALLGRIVVEMIYNEVILLAIIGIGQLRRTKDQQARLRLHR